jgi:tRNA(fMet)-specific endonuclease VapC
MKNNPSSVFRKFQQQPIGSISISFVTYGELMYGALRSNYVEENISNLEEFCRLVPVLNANKDVAAEYADIRAALVTSGSVIGNNDLWIAAHARAMNHTLVTNNLREFERVENLSLENWI